MDQIDDRDFFQAATLKICSSLDVNKALKETIHILRKMIPADGVLLMFYNRHNAMAEVVAGYLPGVKEPTGSIYMPPEVRRDLDNLSSDLSQQPRIFNIERLGCHELAFPLAKQLGIMDASGLHMRLILEGKYIGGVALINMGGIKFDDEHQRLFQLFNEPFAIALSNYIRYREVLELKEMLANDNRFLKEQLEEVKAVGIIGAELGLMPVMEKAHRVSRSDSPVLILGETGTGKELIANAIHNNSKRSNKPFVKVNCGAIPDTLIDSELFGHEKGAFTGAAVQKKGRFERADHGTIFLDEIGELPLGAQVRLLRVLQDGEIERVGGSAPVKLDIRIIAATHRNLEQMIEKEKFRDDLYFRLNVFPIHVPPLRDRLEDIPYLVNFFIKKKCRDMGIVDLPSLGPGEIEMLKTYRWPGNVRELENIVERGIILSDGDSISFKGLLKTEDSREDIKSDIYLEGAIQLDDVISRHLNKVLSSTNGRIHGSKGAAALLGVNSSTLRAKMNKLGISYGRKVSKKHHQS